MRRFPSPKGPWRHRRSTVLAAIARREWLLQMLALGAAGCRRGEDRAYSRSTTATIAYEERNLNPDYDEPDKRLVFLPLVVENETGELEGRLAERWGHSADYREWTYHLRPGVRWHDGVPVSAHDLKFSLDLLAHPDVLAFGPTAFESVTVLDDLTVTIRTGRIANADAYNTWPICYPKHRLERLDPKHIADWEFWTHPLGNGPYRFVRYLPQTMIEFEASSDYYRGTPKIEHVRLKFASRESSLTELLSGNVDSTSLDPEQVAMLAGDRRFRVYYDLAHTAVQTIWWQHGHPFFRDPRVRLALTLAINRRELLQVLRLPDTIPLVDGPFSRRQLRRGELPTPVAHEPARARALLDEVGWRDQGANRLRERAGRPFRFTAIVRENVTGSHATAVYVQDQLRRVGVGMDIQFVDQGSIYAQMRSGRFEAALVPSIVSAVLFGERSWIRYTNAAAARLIDRLETTLDRDARDAIYRELTAICRADVPVTFLCPWVGTTVTHQRLQGLSSPWRTDPVQYMEDLWIDDRAKE